MKGATKSERRKTHMSLNGMVFHSQILTEMGSFDDIDTKVVNCEGAAIVIAPKYEKVEMPDFIGTSDRIRSSYQSGRERGSEVDPIALDVSEMFSEYAFSATEFEKLIGYRYSKRDDIQRTPGCFHNPENPFELN